MKRRLAYRMMYELDPLPDVTREEMRAIDACEHVGLWEWKAIPKGCVRHFRPVGESNQHGAATKTPVAQRIDA